MEKQEVRALLNKGEKSEREFSLTTYENMEAVECIKSIQEDLEFTNQEMAELFKIILGEYNPQAFSRSWYAMLIGGKVNAKTNFYKDALLKFLFKK